MSTPAAIDVFVARCQARAILVAHGQEHLADAVDEMQAAAIASGLVEQLGADGVQAAMAEAFARWR